MITAGEFRNGVTFEMDGKVMQVIEFQHVKPGKGAAFVRTKMRNVITGGVTETSFNPTEKFENAFVDRKNMEYSYADGDLYYFMDSETYEQHSIADDTVGADTAAGVHGGGISHCLRIPDRGTGRRRRIGWCRRCSRRAWRR